MVLAEMRMDRGRTGEASEDQHEEGTDESGELAVEEMTEMSTILWGVVGVGVNNKEKRERESGRGEGALVGLLAGGGDDGGCKLSTGRLASFEATLCVVTASLDELPALCRPWRALRRVGLKVRTTESTRVSMPDRSLRRRVSRIHLIKVTLLVAAGLSRVLQDGRASQSVWWSTRAAGSARTSKGGFDLPTGCPASLETWHGV